MHSSRFLFFPFSSVSLASSRVVARMRRAYLSAVLAQDQTYFETIGPGEVASRLSRDIGLVQSGIGERLGFILWSCAGIVCGSEYTFLYLFSEALFIDTTLVLFSFSKSPSPSTQLLASPEFSSASFLSQSWCKYPLLPLLLIQTRPKPFFCPGSQLRRLRRSLLQGFKANGTNGGRSRQLPRTSHLLHQDRQGISGCRFPRQNLR